MKPMIRWMGGKTTLCDILEEQLPTEYRENKHIPKYFEPFVGGGSFLFDLLTKQYDIPYIYISDINKDLMLLYNIIRDYPEQFINLFNEKINEYKECTDKQIYYYTIRAQYNQNDHDLLNKAVTFVLLNKMCYNSLYRLNQRGEFNVSYNHKYVKNPQWISETNIYDISNALSDAHILCSDYSTSLKFSDSNSFFYLDIPYQDTWSYNTESDNLLYFTDFLTKLSQRKSSFLISSFENSFKLSFPVYTYNINKYHCFDRKIKDEILIRNYEV